MHILNSKVRLGYAEVDITPTFPVKLIGFDRQDNMSRGVLHRLTAQIMIWDDSAKCSCMVAIDSLGFTVALSNILRDAIGDKLQISRERVMLCFSHTHSAPDAGDGITYFDFVCTQILKGIDAALTTLAPVKAVWGMANVGIGVNRRDQNGRLDKRIGILKIVAEATDQLRLILLRVTAHANVLSSDNYLISSDFFGVTRELLGKEYGCKVVITQGASGNVRPRYQHTMAVFMEEHPHEAAAMEKTLDTAKKLFDESMAALHQMAAEIDRAVGENFESLIPEPVYKLDMFSEIETFWADVPSMEQAGQIAAEAGNEAGIAGISWLAEVKRLHAEKIRRQNEEIEIQYFILNNGCWCGVAAEVMCEIALDVSEKTHNQFVYFGGYTNGCGGYLPTEAEYHKGGYEVLWSYLLYYKFHGHVMPLNCDTAEKLTEFIVNQWIFTL